MTQKNQVSKTCPICKSTFSVKASQSAIRVCCSQACNVERKGQLCEQSLSASMDEPLPDVLRRLYLVEHKTYREICSMLNIGTRTLMKLLAKYDIQPRSPQEAITLQWVRNPQRRQQQSTRSKANTGNPSWSKGLTKTDHPSVMRFSVTKMGDLNPMKQMSTREKRAQSISKYYREHPFPQEQTLAAALDHAGIEYTFQHPLGPYVLDFAFVPHKLDIEVDTRSKWGSQRCTAAAERDAYMQKHGWHTVRLTKHDVLENADGIVQRVIIPLLTVT